MAFPKDRCPVPWCLWIVSGEAVPNACLGLWFAGLFSYILPECSGFGILGTGDFVVNPQENSKSKPPRPFAIKRKQIASQTQQLWGPLAFVMGDKGIGKLESSENRAVG